MRFKFLTKRILTSVLVLALFITALYFFIHSLGGDPAAMMAKPVIYLYPEKDTEVSVKVEGVDFSVTYPEYNGGWSVLAKPDGTIYNLKDGSEYSYLFWEGTSDIEYDFSSGFCVKGEDTLSFLRSTLSKMGLTPKEYNEFIVYWYPLMKDNAYNLISFQRENYENAARLTVYPEPESVLRIFMAWKAVDAPVDIEPQTIEGFTREGFTVVEWGGAQVK